jgi:hypothetical protein
MIKVIDLLLVLLGTISMVAAKVGTMEGGMKKGGMTMEGGMKKGGTKKGGMKKGGMEKGGMKKGVPDDEGPACDCGHDEVCVDDPSDDCFGCTCPTICRSISPVVCGGAGCPPNLVCIVENPFCGGGGCGRICVAVDEKQKSPCGGITGQGCLSGQTCIYQDCDPKIGADCGGVCVQKIGSFCGGFAGFRCYDGLECVDPLGDGCDNQCNGAADCGGICLPGVSPE